MYINDYTRGYETIIEKMNPYTYRFSQSDAGFKVDTKEHILNVEIFFDQLSPLHNFLCVEESPGPLRRNAEWHPAPILR